MSEHPLVLGLDDVAAADVANSGAKGAGLAKARAAGLPVLDGFVIGPRASAEALARASELLAERGSGGARMSIIGASLDDELLAAIESAAATLPEPLIVRSSSVLEGDGEWSGAFTSVPEVRRGEIAKATRSVWATNFALEVLERFEAAGIEAGRAPMGVVVQQEILPAYGGAARVDEQGAVTVTAVKGSPRDLMAGWAPGVRAVFEHDKLTGTEAVELMGEERILAIVELARQVSDTLDHNLIEWAVHDDTPVLLQIQRSQPSEVDGGVVIPAALAHPFAREFVELAHRFPGSLGEELVLGWLPGLGLAAGERPESALSGASPPGAQDPIVGEPDRQALLGEARTLARELTGAAWGLPPDEAVATAGLVLRRMRSDRPNESIDALRELRPVEPAKAARLLALFDRLAADEAQPERRGLDRWEPVLAGVAALQGEAHSGHPSVGGIGAGRLVWVESSTRTEHVRPRDIIVTQYPLPNLSPLLWDAAGVVTLGGAPTAHLFEVARSLTVPAVVDCPIGDVIRAGPCLGMVDGDAGRVALLRD